MILTAYYVLEDPKPFLTIENPKMLDVARVVRTVDWNRFTNVTLTIDEDNWLDGSGSMDPVDGLSMMLSVDVTQYVATPAPTRPEDMFEPFRRYLEGDLKWLFAYIYDAERLNLSDEQVEALRAADIQKQQQLGQPPPPTPEEIIAEANDYFATKDYATFIERLTPHESILSSIQRKKLEIARRKLEES